MPALITKIANFSLKDTLSNRLKNTDRPFWSAFVAAFTALNILFLFHSAHYLFGDHDWQYVKSGVPLTAGLFEGRFTQFILINLLTRGEILPIVNNLTGFAGYSLGLALLARYWQLPHNKQAYILFALFGAVTPYILSFMYFAFLILPVLTWSAFVIGGMLIAEKGLSIKHTLTSAILFTLALGGYPPIINLIATALATRLLLSLLPLPSHCEAACCRGNLNPQGHTPPASHCEATPSSPVSILKTTLPPLLISLIAYKLILIYLTRTGAINSSYYNLQTTPIAEWGSKTILVLKDLFRQFTATLPFIPASYKAATATLTLLALLATLTKRQTPPQTSLHAHTPLMRPSPLSVSHCEESLPPLSVRHCEESLPPLSVSHCEEAIADVAISTNKGTPTPNILPSLLFAAIPLAALATLFISTSTAETEFSPRIDFFGLNYVYMAMLALTLRSPQKWIRNLAHSTAILTIIISANQIFEAQKVWKLGFDAEQSLYRRILKRHEQSPQFNPHGRYIIVQAGSPSFRHKYYHTPHTYASDDLLNISYTPGMNAGVMWNYLSPTDYADTTSYTYTFQPDAAAKAALRHAAPYPAANSTATGTYWLLTILTPESLKDLQTRYLP